MADSISKYCDTLSCEQLDRFYRQLMDRAYRAFDGGLMFGVDWCTLHISNPGLAIGLAIVLRVQRKRTADGDRKRE